MRITEERWLPIPDYPCGYYVSNLGKIKRVFTRRVGSHVVCFCKILCPSNNGRYQITRFRKECKRWYLHRLVATLFLPIPEKYKGIHPSKLNVDHVDGCVSNNRADNLRWCLPVENANYPLHRLNLSLARKGKASWKKGLVGIKQKAVILLGGDGGYFESPKVAAKITGISLFNVYASAYHRRTTTNGFRFRYINE